MDRINHASAEADKFGAGKDGWTNGDPVDPGSGTVPQAAFLDGVQEELVGIIETAGLTPSNADYTQLLAGLRALLIAKTTPHAIVFSGRDNDRNPVFSRLDDSVATDASRTLVWFVEKGSNFIHMYVTNDGIEITRDAFWTSGGWINVGANPGLVRIDCTGNAVVPILQEWGMSGGVFTSSRAVGRNPVEASIKGIGNGVSAGVTATSESIGIASVTAIATAVTLQFDSAFANSNYIAVGSSSIVGAAWTAPAIIKTSASQLIFVVHTGGVVIDHLNDVFTFDLICAGSQ